MKKIAIIIITLFFLFIITSCNQNGSLNTKTPENGFGEQYDSGGNLVYQGEFKNGFRHGKGKMYSSNGTLSFDGNFENDKKSGYGKAYTSFGELLYEGEFKDGLYHGQGALYSTGSQLSYKGEFKKGQPNGHVIVYASEDLQGEILYEGNLSGWYKEEQEMDSLTSNNKVEPQIGMTADEVIKILGEPKDINRTILKDRTDEQWVYYTKYLYFEDGILTAIQD